MLQNNQCNSGLQLTPALLLEQQTVHPAATGNLDTSCELYPQSGSATNAAPIGILATRQASERRPQGARMKPGGALSHG